MKKFKDMWKSGLDAHFVVHTNAGQAWVHLHVRLGHAPGPLPQHQPRQSDLPKLRRACNGPSRQRSFAARELNKESEINSVSADVEKVLNAAKKDIETIDDQVEQLEVTNSQRFKLNKLLQQLVIR